MEVISESVSDLDTIAGKVVEYAGKKCIWLFLGEMGAGKTTLIKSICAQLGVEDTVSSPSFSIVNEYIDHNGNPVYHFDFYRLRSQEEAMDIGVDEYFDSGYLCLLEWPEKIPDLIPDEYLEVSILRNTKDQRHITLTHHG